MSFLLFMPKLFRILLIVLSILTGATFLYSAYTKLYPIQPFEYTMVEYVRLPWMFAAVAARFFIGLEAGLGALLLFNIYGKNKWLLKTAFALLVAFSLYLVCLWITAGNQINCGCFGDAIWMSPSASLVKNAVLLLIIGALIRFHKGVSARWAGLSSPLLMVVAIALPFILFAIPEGKPSWLRKDRYKMDLSSLNHKDKADTSSAASPIPYDFGHGKYIVAFLSQSCPHCRIAAYKMHVMKQNNPSLPLFMIIGGTSDLTDFWEKTKAQNIPYTRLEKNAFLRYTGGVFPMIVWMNNGWVEANADYNTLSESEIQKWLTN